MNITKDLMKTQYQLYVNSRLNDFNSDPIINESVEHEFHTLNFLKYCLDNDNLELFEKTAINQNVFSNTILKNNLLNKIGKNLGILNSNSLMNHVFLDYNIFEPMVKNCIHLEGININPLEILSKENEIIENIISNFYHIKKNEKNSFEINQIKHYYSPVKLLDFIYQGIKLIKFYEQTQNQIEKNHRIRNMDDFEWYCFYDKLENTKENYILNRNEEIKIKLNFSKRYFYNKISGFFLGIKPQKNELNKIIDNLLNIPIINHNINNISLSELINQSTKNNDASDVFKKEIIYPDFNKDQYSKQVFGCFLNEIKNFIPPSNFKINSDMSLCEKIDPLQSFQITSNCDITIGSNVYGQFTKFQTAILINSKVDTGLILKNNAELDYNNPLDYTKTGQTYINQQNPGNYVLLTFNSAYTLPEIPCVGKQIKLTDLSDIIKKTNTTLGEYLNFYEIKIIPWKNLYLNKPIN